ncbi:tRNA (adenosine(37)-N6)-threonylcarbamoyltransferase complex ATPase subunit type 1 TsaE, partial [Paraburkholderia sp. SIMBA_050]
MPATPHPPHADTLPAPLAQRVIALADEAATEAFGARFAHALDAARTELARTHAFAGLQ